MFFKGIYVGFFVNNGQLVFVHFDGQADLNLKEIKIFNDTLVYLTGDNVPINL